MAHFWLPYYKLLPLFKKKKSLPTQKSLYLLVLQLLCERCETGLTVRLCIALTLTSKLLSTIQLCAAWALSLLKALRLFYSTINASEALTFKKSLSLHPNLKHHQAFRLWRAFSQLSALLEKCLIVADSNGLKWVLTVSQFKHTSPRTCIRAWEWEWMCLLG